MWQSTAVSMETGGVLPQNMKRGGERRERKKSRHEIKRRGGQLIKNDKEVEGMASANISILYIYLLLYSLCSTSAGGM